VGIVSPQWVHQSLRTGRQQRCLTVSADTSRHLPATSAAADSSQLRQQASGTARGGNGSGSSVEQLSPDLLLSREARQKMLSQLAGSNDPAGAAAAAAGGHSAARPGALAAHQQATTPAELLGDVLWSVLEPPAAAQKEAAEQRQQQQHQEQGDQAEEE